MSGTVTMREAAQRLGISNTKIWRLVKEGILTAQRNPLDGRERLIRTSDLERLVGQTEEGPRFVSDGVVNIPGAPHATETEAYLREHWHR